MRGGDGAGKREDVESPPPFSAGEAGGTTPRILTAAGPLLRYGGTRWPPTAQNPETPKFRKFLKIL